MDADLELVARVQAGDARAFNELFRLHRARVARLVQRFVAVREVEDVVQEVFLHVHRSLASFRGDSKFSTWLYRLALNIARMHVRKQASRPKFSGEEPNEIEDSESSERNPEALAMRTRRLAALQLALADIAEKKREVFVLHDLDGMQAKDIAELVDAPVLTVRTRLFYARKELLEKMRAYPELADLAGHFAGTNATGEPEASDGERKSRAKSATRV